MKKDVEVRISMTFSPELAKGGVVTVKTPRWTSLPTVEEMQAAGATLLRSRDDEISWDVMADPEGNEFCVLRVLGPGDTVYEGGVGSPSNTE